MLHEESGKNLFKAKIKGWALLVVSFFQRIYEPWHSKMAFEVFRSANILFKP